MSVLGQLYLDCQICYRYQKRTNAFTVTKINEFDIKCPQSSFDLHIDTMLSRIIAK